MSEIKTLVRGEGEKAIVEAGSEAEATMKALGFEEPEPEPAKKPEPAKGKGK